MTNPSHPTDGMSLKKHFEANMLDGAAIQKGQMISSAEAFEYAIELLASKLTQLEGKAETLYSRNKASKPYITDATCFRYTLTQVIPLTEFKTMKATLEEGR